MTEMRKVTAFIPADVLERAQMASGAGVSETLRIALQNMVHEWARQELMALQGTVDLEGAGLTLQDLRNMDEDVGHRAA